MIVELAGAGPGCGLAAVARVAHAAPRPDGYLVGCALLGRTVRGGAGHPRVMVARFRS